MVINSNKTMLYNNGPAMLLGAFVVLLLMAAFAAGLIAFFVYKKFSKRIIEIPPSVAMMESAKVAVLTTLAMFFGSLAGYVLFSDAGSSTLVWAYNLVKNDFVQSLYTFNYFENDPSFKNSFFHFYRELRFIRGFDAFLFLVGKVFILHALPFFLEVFFSLVIANLLVMHQILHQKYHALSLSLSGFFTFVLIKLIWTGGLLALFNPIALLRAVFEKIIIPFELVYRSIFSVDILFPLKWLWAKVLLSGGNQFELTGLYPTILFVIFSATAVNVIRGSAKELFDDDQIN